MDKNFGKTTQERIHGGKKIKDMTKEEDNNLYLNDKPMWKKLMDEQAVDTVNV